MHSHREAKPFNRKTPFKRNLEWKITMCDGIIARLKADFFPDFDIHFKCLAVHDGMCVFFLILLFFMPNLHSAVF